MHSFIKLILWVLAGISLSGISMVFASEAKNLFGMNCTVTRITTNQPNIKESKVVFDAWAYIEELWLLKVKWYTRIDLIKNFNVNWSQIKILLWEKCGKNMLRINGQESINDLWVDHIQKKLNQLVMYGITGNIATMITCDLSTITGNDYKAFDLPKNTQNNQSETTNTTGNLNNQTGSIINPDLSVSEILKAMWGNWERDRQNLAKQLGIENYQGTREQNLKIRVYLLSQSKIEINPTKATNTPDIYVSQKVFDNAKQDIVFNIVRLFGYTRKYDRLWLALENNILTGYRGTRTQNLKIRRFLLNKIKIK